MINQDIHDGWIYLNSLSDEEWRTEMNNFFDSIESPVQIPYGFTRMKQLRKDMEKVFESQLSTWFCTLELAPRKLWPREKAPA